MRRLAIATFGLLLAVPAQAGGVGVLMTGGMHSERVWFHSDHAIPEGGGDAVLIDSPKDYERYENTQTLPNVGGGIELILGDRDDRFLGAFRIYALQDGPQSEPSSEVLKDEYIVSNIRDTPRTTGLGTVGLTWGFLDLGDSMRLGVSTHIGSGFLTTDHLEYFALDAGPTYTWRASRNVMLVGDITWQMRHHKIASHSINAFVTARYMFD
ncbi:MAG: hypothetical protein GWP91_21685 [Rhodobacterales bacterium]|nr:hypothetical protein [Rhodobacterales bacterium]